MSDAELYLRALRQALPLGCRRRLVAEMREHFASAVAAEAAHGLDAREAERLTIERLGPAHALAEQLLVDLRSGALGRVGRLTAALTTGRLLACASVLAIAIAVVAGTAVFAARHPSPTRPTPERAARPTVTLDPRTGDIRAVMYAVQTATAKHQSSITFDLKPVTYYTPAPK